MTTLQRAIEIALEAHRGQVDKAGALYILHPLRVMLSLLSEEQRIVGILHDVVEDCVGWDLTRLGKEGFSSEVIDAIDAVTKRPAESSDYMAFIDRVARDPIARAVKIADIRDNMNLDRIATPTIEDHTRVARYREALARLLPTS
jgi:(p)ppGpp synthase/HD superfamily hydrolase